ncbi:uncharacterized protein M6B38_366975 [Iris pallida]|uniref:Uncharacterized protein n=1 Tax=Iris pallida TaxID=29817 RepID=A0AAX6GGH0_IRIPA|nr:uncharacterized protein M6B38_366970 [Iris pallida]KAJ6827623.1 uncharacterized protein M6B38_366975 [Iris pallida]
MVAFYLYRGKLHRPADAPREWPTPPRTISLDQFKILTQKRALAISRLAAAAGDPDSKEKNDKEEEEEYGFAVVENTVAPPENNGVKEPEEEAKEKVVGAAPVVSIADAEMDESKSSDDVTDKEKRKQEVEKKLQVLNKKKHDLVQMLKLILKAEEEFKRRNAQSASISPSVPQQAENAVDMGSVTRHVPKLSVEVNFGGDLGAESDATANSHSHGRRGHQLHNTSPSAGPFARPFHGSPHQNSVTTYERRMRK